MNKPKLLVCFSGGRTSAYMSKLIKKMLSDIFDIIFIFANTGQENNETLEFVNQCDLKWGLSVIWVEAITHDGRKGCTHKIVNYETAHRITDKKEDSPYFKMVKKYGLANKAYPHCTRELKENPIHDYLKMIGWKKGEYLTALGIRTDEPVRIKRGGKQLKVYPLVDWWPADKIDVMDYWENQSFNLDLKDYQGNCAWCFKKSKNKLLTIMREKPYKFEFPLLIEELFGKVGPNKINGVLSDEPRTIFREYMTTKKLMDLNGFVELLPIKDDEQSSGCSQSCEPFAGEDDELE